MVWQGITRAHFGSEGSSSSNTCQSWFGSAAYLWGSFEFLLGLPALSARSSSDLVEFTWLFPSTTVVSSQLASSCLGFCSSLPSPVNSAALRGFALWFPHAALMTKMSGSKVMELLNWELELDSEARVFTPWGCWDPGKELVKATQWRKWVFLIRISIRLNLSSTSEN